jgi:galactokinase/mevalonate kinase-like predicted kinase
MHTRAALQRLPLAQSARLKTGTSYRGDGTDFEPLVQQVGDAFYRCAVEINKLIYSRIDARYPSYQRDGDREIREQHRAKMDEARRTLNEARNLVLKEILPLFMVRLRKTGEIMDDADIHAHDYIVRNAFDEMVKTHKAWVDQYVKEDEVATLIRSIEKVAAIQRERLAVMLQTFSFAFKKFVAASKPLDRQG